MNQFFLLPMSRRYFGSVSDSCCLQPVFFSHATQLDFFQLKMSGIFSCDLKVIFLYIFLLKEMIFFSISFKRPNIALPLTGDKKKLHHSEVQ